MNHTLSPFKIAVLGVFSLLAACLWLMFGTDAALPMALATGTALDMTAVMKGLDGIEAKLKAMSDKAEGEMATLGKVSADTKTALDNIGTEQRVFAERLLKLEQKGVAQPGADAPDSWGQQFVKAASYADFAAGRAQRLRVEVKNTVTNTVGNTFTDRKPGVVSGAFRNLSIESLLNTLPTSSNAVDYVRENVFTNAAAETAEGGVKPESSLTTTLVTEPVATVAHWIKISRQLAMDNAALAAYIDLRMRYGVNLRVENQLINGNGTAPNISGMSKAGNFTAHGYTAANLTTRFGASYTRIDMIRAIIADCAANDYPAEAILLNPVDWANIEAIKDSQGRYIVGDPAAGAAPRLWGLPVAASNAVTADTVFVANLSQAATLYNREGLVVDMSESDSDNFTKNLVTIRAERRCMLAVERPAAIRYGDLTPA
jgi:HK97 family phage major capsid protein